MAGKRRAVVDESIERPVKPSNKYWFINNELVYQIRVDRGANLVYLRNISKQDNQVMLLTVFKRERRRAYSFAAATRILGRSHQALKNYIAEGGIRPPVPISADGKRGNRIKSFYSEDDIYAIHRYMQTKTIGRPSLLGINPGQPMLTEQELRAKMGDALILYTRLQDGTFIPTWKERIR